MSTAAAQPAAPMAAHDKLVVDQDEYEYALTKLQYASSY
jgi:hypothetical protein